MDNMQLEPVYPGQNKQKIESIQFSLLSAEEIMKMRIPVTTGQMYDPNNHTEPMRNGPLDLRLVSSLTFILYFFRVLERKEESVRLVMRTLLCALDILDILHLSCLSFMLDTSST